MEANIMKYIDSIDWGAKNQLGKVLEHCFYEKQHREYTSCIKDESEDYSSACDLTKKDAHKTMKKLNNSISIPSFFFHGVCSFPCWKEP